MAALVLAGPAWAQHPGRHLESRRASAPVVYLATVLAVQQVGQGEGPGAPPRMEATLRVDRVIKGEAVPGDPVVRYELAPATGAEDVPAAVSYRVAVGDRAVVFAPSFATAFPIEMVVGPSKEVAAQVTALQAFLAEMDEPTARLHGVTPAVRAQQTAVYGRVLADLARTR